MTDAKDIFLRAIECSSPNERAQLIDEACGEDTVLRRRVEALLAAHDDPDSYLERPAAKFDVTATHDGSGSNLSDSSSSHHGRFLPGTKVAGRYRIVSMLGRGGMGEVYRADDMRLGQTVALKFLPPELAKDAKRLEYFHNEVRLARQIAHPNVCRVYDIGEVDGQHFISMEYIDGEDLKTLLHRIGRVPVDKGIQIAQQLCAGLAAAHAKGVLHRDLKPANIMLDGQGQVRITDFGLATFTGDGENIIGMSGTPAYMAPEQLLRGHTSVQSDIYSLGLILHELFTAKTIHSATTLPELRRFHEETSQPTSGTEWPSDMDPAVDRAIRKSLEADPADRPTSVPALAASLPGGDPLAATIAAGETPSPELVAAAGDHSTMSRHTGWFLFAGIVVGLFVVAFIAQRGVLVNQIDTILAPQVLEYRAKQILRHLGYDTPTSCDGIASGFNQADFQSENMKVAETNGLPGWPLLRFWYRESDQGFGTETMGFKRGTSGPARVDEWNPAWEVGMRGVCLDTSGRLMHFRALPASRQFMVSGSAGAATWSDWFPPELVGIDLSTLEETTPANLPPVQFDEIQCWYMQWPNADEKVEIVAAALNGHPVYFEVLPTVPSVPTYDRSDAFFLIVSVIACMNLVAIILVIRNMYLGRWDRRGAWRLLVGMFGVTFVAKILGAYHAPSLWERAVIHVCIGSAFAWSGELWLYYVSFEPFVRRWWPGLLIGWSRLLGGRIGDSRVGTDVLFGVAIGVLHSVLFLLGSSFDSAPPVLINSDSLAGMMPLFGKSLSNLYWATFISLLYVSLLTVLRMLTRSQITAGAIVVGIAGTVHSMGSSHLGYWVCNLLADLVIVVTLVRFGLFASICASFVGGLMLSPLTLNASRFYFSYGLFGVAVVMALALYGVVVATKSWPLRSRTIVRSWNV